MQRILTQYDRKDSDTTELQFSNDGRTLLAGDGFGRLRFWSSDNWGFLGALRVVPKDVNSGIYALNLTPDADALDLAIGHVAPDHRRLVRVQLQSE